MSQTKNALNKIASGEEYKALVAAIEKKDAQAIVNSYLQISKLIDEAEKGIAEKINSLTRQNKDDDLRKFQASFDVRLKTTLPGWHWLNEELKKQKVTEGIVIGLGKQGDPMVRTQEGRIVIVRGVQAKEGERVKLQITGEGAKVDFGKPFELTADSLYFVLSQDVREKMQTAFNTAREHAENFLKEADKKSLTELSDVLKELEDIKPLASALQEKEQQEISSRILVYRRRLCASSLTRLAFDFITQNEEKEIRESCQGDEQKIARALSAPGLFRRQPYDTLKAELFSGEQPKGYNEIASELESNMGSMQKALELMEFQSKIEEVVPDAKQYFSRMDMFYQRLNERVRRAAFSLAEDKIFNLPDVENAIKNIVSGEAMYTDLRRSFRSPEDFFALRGALVELRTRLGDKESAPAEAAIKPYLRQKLAMVFGEGKVMSSPHSAS